MARCAIAIIRTVNEIRDLHFIFFLVGADSQGHEAARVLESIYAN